MIARRSSTKTMNLLTNTPDLTLDADHVYRYRGETVEGVTSVLQDNGFVDDSWYTETHSSRGQAIHEVLAGVAHGLTFDWDLLDVDLHPWAHSGIDFLKKLQDEGAKIRGIEVRLYHPLYRFAGTMDLYVEDWRGADWVLDYKTGLALPCARFQLAGYDQLLGALLGPGARARKKASVEVQRDGGRARLVEYNGLEHFHDGNRFLSYLTTSRDRALFGPKLHRTSAAPLVH